MGRKLTVITVTRNDARRLSSTLESYRSYVNNSCLNFLIVDGSDNNETHDLVMDYFPNIKSVRIVKRVPCGIYDAMNFGLRNVDDGWVLFLNSGDKLVLEASALVDLVSKLPDHQALVYCGYLRNFSSFSKNFKEEVVKPRTPLLGVRWRMPTSHQAILYKLDILRGIQFSGSYKFAADYNNYIEMSTIFPTMAFAKYSIVSSVEYYGTSFENPFDVYREYLHIQFSSLDGLERFLAVLLTLVRGMAVILVRRIQFALRLLRREKSIR